MQDYEVQSDRYPKITPPVEVTTLDSLRKADRGLYDSVSDTMAALRNDMLSPEIEMELFEAMGPNSQRTVVSRIAGLDASVLMTFKQMLNFVQTVLRQIIKPDGTKNTEAGNIDLSVKDAMAMAIRVTQVMTKDMPKIYTVERIQKQERALQMFMERHLTREQQSLYLKYLQQIEKELEDEH